MVAGAIVFAFQFGIALESGVVNSGGELGVAQRVGGFMTTLHLGNFSCLFEDGGYFAPLMKFGLIGVGKHTHLFIDCSQLLVKRVVLGGFGSIAHGFECGHDALISGLLVD